ncbi:MAG: hypothetical protein HZA90_06470 [Verrucomicrobia bacterium]|nr:hypothetical protein [Verrucomicrobiota bacterium]
MVEHIEAEQFHSFTATGYSRPARVTCSRQDGTKVDVFVKFAGGVRHREFGLSSELLCNLLARAFGLHTPTPFLVTVSKEFLAGIPAPARDLVGRSRGLNYGSQSAPVGFSVVPPEPQVPHELRSEAARIFAFDVIVQNYDRKADNPNLLWDRRTILLIDHESAFGPMLQERKPSFSALELDRFYDHVFYPAISPQDAGFEELLAAMQSFSAARLEETLGQIPPPWQVEAGWARVREHLVWVLEHRDQVCRLIRERLT